MTIVNVHKGWSGNEIELSRDRRAITDGWTVLSTTIQETESAVVNAAGLPVLFVDVHPVESDLLCTRKKARRLGPLLWEVEVIYSASQVDGGTPLNSPPRVRFGTVRSTEPIDFDYDGATILNSAFQRFDPPVSRTFSERSMIVERVKPLAALDVPTLFAYQDAVNSDDWDTPYGEAPAGCAKLDVFDAVAVLDPVAPYWEVLYEIHFRRGVPESLGPNNETQGGQAKAWWLRILDAGMDEMEVATVPFPVPHLVAKVTPIMGLNGVRVSSPVPLNGLGRQLTDGDPPRWLEFQQYPELSFNDLDIFT